MRTIGAVVIGGDYQGLGIVRSLGRQKVPVCVIDDERSIARFSRYTTHAAKVDSLRGEKETVRPGSRDRPAVESAGMGVVSHPR